MMKRANPNASTATVTAAATASSTSNTTKNNRTTTTTSTTRKYTVSRSTFFLFVVMATMLLYSNVYRSPPLSSSQSTTTSSSSTTTTSQKKRRRQRLQQRRHTKADINNQKEAVVQQVNNNNNNNNKVKNKIREWGCQLNSTPFIFYHIGKAGGGSVRRRFASASQNYTSPSTTTITITNKKGKSRALLWHEVSQQGAYFPMTTTGTASTNGSKSTTIVHHHRGTFCNSKHGSFHPTQEKKYFEPAWPCPANTPLGQAIACPFKSQTCCGNVVQDKNLDSCRIVYTGHNGFGNEVHWLPPKYLHNWWVNSKNDRHLHRGNNDNNDDDDDDDNRILQLIDTIHTDEWCNGLINTGRANQIQKLQKDCLQPISDKVDELAYKLFPQNNQKQQQQQQGVGGGVEDWSELYGSIPLIRVTMVRDPFSWLLSKFFWAVWKKDPDDERDCGDIKNAVIEMNRTTFIKSHESDYRGWASIRAMGYVYMLCGEDCESRLYNGVATLDDLLVQAENNLRRAFHVVGLLNETETFYAMVDARVHYMDMFQEKNRPDEGGEHSSVRKNNAEYYNQCKELYDDPDFRRKLMKASPEVAAINRLWETAVEVNRFQLAELRSCSNHPMLFLPDPQKVE